MAFHYKNGEMFCEDVPLAQLAKEYGTPLYVYSKAQLAANCAPYQQMIESGRFLPCYAVKANSSHSLMKEIFRRGFGADIVSVGELERALKAGAESPKIVFSGVGKQGFEIRRALEAGIKCLNVESVPEIQQIAKIAETLGLEARISLRINPNIPVKTHPHIATGLYRTKFGIAEKDIPGILKEIKNLPQLKLVGFSCHLGSQILTTKPFEAAARRLIEWSKTAQKAGFRIQHLDIGGGLGITYQNEKPVATEKYLDAIDKIVGPTGLSVLVEPGRSIIGNTGSLLTSVILVKKNPHKNFVVVDAAMNDLIRPSLYEAYHPIEPVKKARGSLVADVVGPICETGDYLGLKRKLPQLKAHDLLLVRHAGAYGMSMASHYNSRPRAAEVLVDGSDSRVITRRESLESLTAHELS